MVTGVFLVGAMRLADPGPSTPHGVFWEASIAARRQALLSGRDVRLTSVASATSDGVDVVAGLHATWEDDGSQFFPFTKMDGVICEFLTTQKGASTILVGGELVETQTVPFITFYGDGTCTPCRVQFRVGGSAYTIEIDPWTCAEILPQKEASQ